MPGPSKSIRLRSRQTYRPCSRTPAGCRQLRLDRCYHRLAISMLPSDRTFQTHYCSIVNIEQTRSYSTLIYSWESQEAVMHTLQGSQLPLRHDQELNKVKALGLNQVTLLVDISASVIYASMLSLGENFEETPFTCCTIVSSIATK